jgi:hypothetical protein
VRVGDCFIVAGSRRSQKQSTGRDLKCIASHTTAHTLCYQASHRKTA